MPNRLLAGLALAFLPALAGAQQPHNQWIVTPGAAGPSGTIEVSIAATPDVGGCPCAVGACMTGLMHVDLSVTPCPPDKPCTEGTYMAYYTGGPVADALTLRCGVLYTFRGSYYQDFTHYMSMGWPPTQVCMEPCLCSGPFVPTTYQEAATPASPASWGRLKLLYR